MMQAVIPEGSIFNGFTGSRELIEGFSTYCAALLDAAHRRLWNRRSYALA
jgi:hypothetical protein